MNYACIYLRFSIAAVEKVAAFLHLWFCDSGPLIQHFFVLKFKTLKKAVLVQIMTRLIAQTLSSFTVSQYLPLNMTNYFVCWSTS